MSLNNLVHHILTQTYLTIEKQIKKPLTFLYANLRISSYSSCPIIRINGVSNLVSVWAIGADGLLFQYLLCPTGPRSPCRLMCQLWRYSFRTLTKGGVGCMARRSTPISKHYNKYREKLGAVYAAVIRSGGVYATV